MACSPTIELKKSNSPDLIAESARKIYEVLNLDIQSQEHMVAIFFDRSLNTIGFTHLSSGSMKATVFDMKRLFKIAINLMAEDFVLIHNHPSGNLNPSQMDIDLTKRLEKAASIMDMRFLDHIILTNESFYSFLNNGFLLPQ